jgi:predicted nucleotidyltransferase
MGPRSLDDAETGMTEGELEGFLSGVLAWAETAPGVHAVALVGSHARGEAGPSSDVDLIVIAADAPALIRESAWVEQFGPVARVAVEDWGKVTSLRVWYRGSFEVEFGITSPDWVARPLDGGTRRTMADGFHVLIDKDGSFEGTPGHNPHDTRASDLGMHAG